MPGRPAVPTPLSLASPSSAGWGVVAPSTSEAPARESPPPVLGSPLLRHGNSPRPGGAAAHSGSPLTRQAQSERRRGELWRAVASCGELWRAVARPSPTPYACLAWLSCDGPVALGTRESGATRRHQDAPLRPCTQPELKRRLLISTSSLRTVAPHHPRQPGRHPAEAFAAGCDSHIRTTHGRPGAREHKTRHRQQKGLSGRERPRPVSPATSADLRNARESGKI